jgi:hypothetical protein
MQGVARNRVLLFLAGLIIVPTLTVAVILFARGFRPDFAGKGLQTTGLLVATSYPNAAQIFVNGQLKSATDSTFNLPPGQYEVEIKKEGFYPWKKLLLVQGEIVTRATAVLFPTVPALKAVTSTGAGKPLLSPDGTRLVFFGTAQNSNNIYTLDLSESPLGLLNRDSKLLTTLPTRPLTLSWSPDSRQVLASASSSAVLIDVNTSQSTNVTDTQKVLQNEWSQREKIKITQKFTALPEKLQPVLATAAADLVWSPLENKLLYTATASAILPEKILKPLPGSNTQPQERTLSPGNVYVYDLEEDRNFKIDSVSPTTPTPAPKTKSKSNDQIAKWPNDKSNAGWNWFPTSSHLYRVTPGQVTILEYDSTNAVTVYAGPMSETVAFPYPSAKQLLILTNLNTTPPPSGPSLPQLYAIPLR